MRRRALTLVFRLSLLGLLCASLSGCHLLNILGFSHSQIDVSRQPGVASTNAVTTNLAADATVAKCLDDIVPNVYPCRYIVDGEDVTSIVDISSERKPKFNFPDPLILEVPSNVMSTTGTYDAGSGPQPLPLSSVHSFAVQPGARITAEAGTTLLILDLPLSVTSGLPISNPAAGPVFSYTLSFQQVYPISATVPPVLVKPLLAGEVTLLWQTYYVPLFPCVNDFASIPAVTIPQASSPQNLGTTLGDLIRNHSVSPCNHKVYDFTQAQLPPGLLFLPLVRH